MVELGPKVKGARPTTTKKAFQGEILQCHSIYKNQFRMF